MSNVESDQKKSAKIHVLVNRQNSLINTMQLFVFKQCNSKINPQSDTCNSVTVTFSRPFPPPSMQRNPNNPSPTSLLVLLAPK